LLLALILSSLSFGKINLVLDYARFFAPPEQPFIEFYLSINGNSLEYQLKENGNVQARLEITYIVEQDEEVVSFKKFVLNSPEYKEGSDKMEMIDIKRLAIPNGALNFTIVARDLVSGERIENTQTFEAREFNTDKLIISDIILARTLKLTEEASNFNKNGYEVIPNFVHYYKENQEEFLFYLEIYNSEIVLGEEEDFLMEFSVIDKNTQAVAANLRSFQKLKTTEVIPILKSLNIANLYNGTYDLQISIKNKTNEVLAERSISFRKYSSLTSFNLAATENTFVEQFENKELLKEHLRSLQPLSSAEEYDFIKNQLAYDDLALMKKYFYNFWLSRNPENPELAWNQYKEELMITDQEFGYGGIRGYQTDRGRVYLQYGKPSSIMNVPFDGDTQPYTIWQYYKLNGLNNRRFIFYSPSNEMLGYQVLHSNVPGEINDPNWQLKLLSKNTPTLSPVRELNGSNIHENSRILFDNPR